MATTIVSNSTAATFGNAPQKTAEPPHHITSYGGAALTFDGVSDYVTSNPPFATLNATTAFTVAMWVNPDNTGVNQTMTSLSSATNSIFIGTYSSKFLFSRYNASYSDILGQKTDDNYVAGK